MTAHHNVPPAQILFLAGQSGVSKGTQLKRTIVPFFVKRGYNVRTINNGDTVRSAGDEDTFVGRRIRQYNETGGLLPKPIFYGLIMSKLSEILNFDPQSLVRTLIIWDGSPRRVTEAEELVSVLQFFGISAIALHLDASDEVCLARMEERAAQHPGRYEDPAGKVAAYNASGNGRDTMKLLQDKKHSPDWPIYYRTVDATPDVGTVSVTVQATLGALLKDGYFIDP